MEGIVDLVSHRKNGVKLQGMEGWLNADQEAVQQALQKVNKGDKVEYSHTEKELTFIKVVQAGYDKSANGPKKGDPNKVPEKVNKDLDLDKLMEESIDTVVKKAVERNESDTSQKIPGKLGEQIEWGKLIISLFIGKSRQA